VKFGYDVDGKLVPIEQLKLQQALADVEAKLDATSAADRPAMVARLREALVRVGRTITPEDESVFTLFTEGVLDLHNVEYHFGEELVRVAGGHSGNV
jgi:hypothetical protein